MPDLEETLRWREFLAAQRRVELAKRELKSAEDAVWALLERQEKADVR